MEDTERMTDKLYIGFRVENLDEVRKFPTHVYNEKQFLPNYNLLCRSLLHKNVNLAKFLVENNCPVNGGNDKVYKGNSALHLTVLFGDSFLVRAMLKRGAWVKTRNADGLMPIHLVVHRNPIISYSLVSPEEYDRETEEIVEAFLDHGINIDATVNSQDKYGFTALHLAAECGNERIIPILLMKNANIIAKSETGLSPLHSAVINGNLEIVDLLLNHGVPAYLRDFRGKTPLCWAIKLKQMEMIEFILNFEYTSIPKRFKFGFSLKDDNYALLQAVKMDDVNIVKCLLEKGALVNTSWRNGITPLHVAVENGSEDIFKLLLDYGADVRAIANDGKTPFYLAVEREWTNIVEILLNCIPEIDEVLAVPNLDGITPLQLAIRKGCVEILQLLLRKGFQALHNPSCQSFPLHTAVIKDRKNILKILLESDIDIGMMDDNGRTALEVAAEQGNLETVRMFCEIFSKRESKWKGGYGALYAAASKGHFIVVKLLLESGADINARIDSCLTPLCIAAEKGHFNIVELLLANGGVDVNEVRADGMSALHCAVENQSCKIIECLLDNNANLNSTLCGDSALHVAAVIGNLKMLLLLIKRGANVNALNLMNATPLFLAVERNKTEVINILISNGANVNIEDNASTIKSFNFSSDCIRDRRSCKGLRPLLVAVDKSSLEIVNMLLNNGAHVYIPGERITPLHLASANGSLEIVKLLLDFGADINSVCEENYTPILHAIANGRTETFVHLLKRGADLKSAPGNSAIHIAIYHKSVKNERIVRLLLESGEDVKVTNVGRETPLHCAISAGNTEEEKIIFELLIDYGSDINAQNHKGETSLHYAAQEGDFHAAEVLLGYGADLNILNNNGNTPLGCLEQVLQDDLLINAYETREDRFCPYAAIAILLVAIIALKELKSDIVDSENLALVRKGKMKCFYEKCKRELYSMKDTLIFNNFSYYHLIYENDDVKLASHLRNANIMHNLEAEFLKRSFPSYFIISSTYFGKAKERKHLFDSSQKNLNVLLKFQVPYVIVQAIFSHLSLSDLRNLNRVFQRW